MPKKEVKTEELEAKIIVKIIGVGLKAELSKDTIEARMVKKRIEDMEAEFEFNGVPTKIWIR